MDDIKERARLVMGSTDAVPQQIVSVADERSAKSGDHMMTTEDEQSPVMTQKGHVAMQQFIEVDSTSMQLRVPKGNILEQGFIGYARSNDDGTIDEGIAVIYRHCGLFVEVGEKIFEVKANFGPMSLDQKHLKSATYDPHKHNFIANIMNDDWSVDPAVIAEAIAKLLDENTDTVVVHEHFGFTVQMIKCQ